MIYDVAIIGAGVVGAFVARTLSRYELNVLCIEKNDDICSTQSKANSAIVHQGFDPLPNTLKAKLNVEGARMFPRIVRQLGVPYKKNGALIVSHDINQKKELFSLIKRAIKNKSTPLYYLSGGKIRRHEKNISKNVVHGLLATNSCIVDPFLLTIRACESAYKNGVKFIFNSEVTGFEKQKDFYIIKCKNANFQSKMVINAAGIYSDFINNLVSEKKYALEAIRGDYIVLDKSQNSLVKRTIFSLPTEKGKGVLVTPSTSGNILLGPTYKKITNKDGTNVTEEGIKEIREKTSINVDNIDYSKLIRTFAGVRSHEKNGDFIIEEAEGCKNFINLIGIESPGLSAAPAISEYVVDKFLSSAFDLKKKPNWDPSINKDIVFSFLSINQKRKLILQDPLYSKIICKCELITQAEILNSITRPLGASTLEGVKKRTRCMMGVCQGGYCQSRIEKILLDVKRGT